MPCPALPLTETAAEAVSRARAVPASVASPPRVSMWTSESFASLELLVAFLNDRRLRPDQVKVVVAHDDDAQRFHLLYQADEGVMVGAATAEAAAEPFL